MSYPIFHSQYTAAQIEASIGKSPRINSTTKMWEIWDIASGAYVSTGVVAESAEYASEAEDCKDQAYAYEQQALSYAAGASAAQTAAEDAAQTASSAKTAAEAASASAAESAEQAAEAVEQYNLLFGDEIPDTVQNYSYLGGGAVLQVIHSRSGSIIRTDLAQTISGKLIEMRELATGETLTITTDLATLETTVVYASAA